MTSMDIRKFIKDVPNFPTKGVLFRDISPLLANGKAMKYVINQFIKEIGEVDIIIGPDSRGFIFGTPVAMLLELPFIMARKPNKLPGKVLSHSYGYEYAETAIEIQLDAIKPGQQVIIIDDVMATGGTTRAIVDLVEKMGGKVIKVVVLIELTYLNGRKYLSDVDIPLFSLIKY